MFSAEKMAEGYALAFFVEMDTNEDGEITEEEFVEGCLSDPMFVQMLTTFSCDFMWGGPIKEY